MEEEGEGGSGGGERGKSSVSNCIDSNKVAPRSKLCLQLLAGAISAE